MYVLPSDSPEAFLRLIPLPPGLRALYVDHRPEGSNSVTREVVAFGVRDGNLHALVTVDGRPGQLVPASAYDSADFRFLAVLRPGESPDDPKYRARATQSRLYYCQREEKRTGAERERRTELRRS